MDPHTTESQATAPQPTGAQASTDVSAKHGGMGVAAFIVALVSAVMIFILVIVAGVLEATTPGGMDEESVAAMTVGLLLMLFMLATLIAIGLSIAGLVQKNSKKVFPILGLIISLLTVVLTFGLMAIGLALE